MGDQSKGEVLIKEGRRIQEMVEGYLPILQILRTVCKIHKCCMQVMFLKWDAENRFEFQGRLGLGCRREVAQPNVLWSLRGP